MATTAFPCGRRTGLVGSEGRRSRRSRASGWPSFQPSAPIRARGSQPPTGIVLSPLYFFGSERESDGRPILGCFLDRVNSDEFDVRHGHPLGLQQQVAEILIAAAAIDQHTDVTVDRLDHPEANLGPTVV